LCIDRSYAGAPLAPRNLRVSSVSRREVEACFDAPSFPSSCPTSYTVTYVEVPPPGALTATLSSSGVPPFLSIAQGGCFTLTDLKPGTRYRVSVQSIRESALFGTLEGGTASTEVATRP
jgi:hypothetical protein